MANLAITNTFTANTLARASEVNTNFTDIKTYVNDRNQGTSSWDIVKSIGTVTISATTSQLVLGGAFNTTITAPTPSNSRIVTIPDAGANSSMVLTEGVQTINGAKTLSAVLTLTPTTNQLVLGTTNTTTITSPAPSANRTVTLPDAGANSSLVLTEGTQTINGSKTFGSATNAPSMNLTATSNQVVMGVTNTVTLNATAPGASRTITIPDVSANANVVLSEGAQTINGAKTFGTRLLAPLGSAAAPSYAGVAQTNSGIRFTTNSASFVCNGVDKIFADSAGKLLILGTATNDNADAGFVGEAIRSFVASGSSITLTTATYADVTSITLSAGDWDISFITELQATVAITGTQFLSGIGTTAGDSGAGLVFGDNATQVPTPPTTASDNHMGISNWRASLTGSTTYYLKVRGAFSSGTLKAHGRISARRIR